jgi:hypothetical protein
MKTRAKCITTVKKLKSSRLSIRFASPVDAAVLDQEITHFIIERQQQLRNRTPRSIDALAHLMQVSLLFDLNARRHPRSLSQTISVAEACAIIIAIAPVKSHTIVHIKAELLKALL